MIEKIGPLAGIALLFRYRFPRHIHQAAQSYLGCRHIQGITVILQQVGLGRKLPGSLQLPGQHPVLRLQ